MSQSNQFRIGACYRTVDGSVVTLHQLSWPLGSAAEPGQAFATELDSNGDLVENRGARYLDSGRYVWDDIGDWPGNLLPGEVDEQGNPIEEKSDDFSVTKIAGISDTPLGDLLRRKLAEVKKEFAEAAFICEDADPNAAMIARDGPAKVVLSATPPVPCPEYGDCTYPDCGHYLDCNKSTAKPALASLISSPDLAGEWKPFEFGSAHLKG